MKIKCHTCKVKFKRPNYLIKRNKKNKQKYSFCSYKCYRKYWKQKVLPTIQSFRPIPVRRCRKCDGKFKIGRRVNYYGYYCSDKCRDKEYNKRIARGKQLKEKRKIKKICIGCKHKFKVDPLDKVSKARKFCVYKCYRKWYNKVGCIEAIRKTRRACRILPNKGEVKLNRKLKPFGFEYVGDGKKMVGRFNPDFINKNSKQIVELFGEYWHKEGSENARIKYFKKYGYECLIIWLHQLNKHPNRTMSQIFQFCKNPILPN